MSRINSRYYFFTSSRRLATPEQLFYRSDDKRYLAYWPKGYEGEKTTLQSRNAFIGNYTEKWCSELLKEFASKQKAYIVQDVVCEEIGLTKLSPADVALCKTKSTVQEPRGIILILEVKMSVAWNWELRKTGSKEELICLGDYNSHQGNPSLLRSDTMLKAIGKSIDIRVSSYKAAKIPIVIIGNTPISNSYYEKVDHLKKCGIVQGFWSVNSKPLDKEDTIKNTTALGFYRFDSYDELEKELNKLLKEDREFFSSMKTKSELGRIIEIANKEDSYEKKAEKFLELIRK
jgi:hypothetical protein